MMDEVLEIISRAEAKKQGLKRFFTGEPCRHGHVSLRNVSNGGCVECRKIEAATASAQRVETAKQWQKDNPEKFKTLTKAYRERHAERDRKKRSTQYFTLKQEDPEALRQKNKESREKYRETYRVVWRNRHARKRKAEGKHTKADIAEIREQQGFLCVGCDVDLRNSSEHVDHIMPLSKGGSNWPSNLQLLCPSCNMSKSALLPSEWVKPKDCK